MPHAIKNRLRLGVLVLITLSSLLLLSVFIAPIPTASAVPPGCYVRPSAAGGELTSVTCPSSLNTAANENLCFAAPFSNPTNFSQTPITCPTDYARLACEASGGDWTITGAMSGATGYYCRCEGRATSTQSPCPRQDANTGAPSYTPNDCNEEDLNQDNCGIIRYIVIFINVLSALAGIAIVAAIIYGGIQYSSAGSDPQKVSAAKVRIRNALMALVFFIFGVAILNWLVPGGVLGRRDSASAPTPPAEQPITPGVGGAIGGDVDQPVQPSTPAPITPSPTSTPSVSFEYEMHRGLMQIIADGRPLLTGCGLGFIGSIDGVDDFDNLTSCLAGNGGVMRPFNGSPAQVPHNLHFEPQGAGRIRFAGHVGPANVDLATISMPMDFNRSTCTQHRSSSDATLRNYSDNSSWGYDIPPGNGPISGRRVNIHTAGASRWGEIICGNFIVRVELDPGIPNTMLFFVNHPDTHNIEFSFGDVPAGTQDFIAGWVTVRYNS